jgi:flavin-dependent dehydrogenase
MHDVLICGAGPAGSLAALILARAGATVVLLDRARFPRDKLCGDTVNPGAVSLLRRHELTHVLEGGLPVDGMIITGASGLRVVARYGAGVQGCAITRRDLDARLAAASVEAGARLDDGVLVHEALVDRSRHAPRVHGVIAKAAAGRSLTIRARVVIAADGRYSRVARGLGLSCHPAAPRRWAIGGYFEGVSGLTGCGEMHIRANRYVGVAPVPGDLANACVVTADRSALRQPDALLLEVLRTDPAVVDRFSAARLIAPPVCVGPLAVECPVPGLDGLLLAGDAAGFIDPMTGDGLRFAFRGAELAAAAALAALEHGWRDAHVRLGVARQREFRSKWRFNRTLRSVVGSPVLMRVADRGAALAPPIIRTLIRYAGDVRAA